MKRDAAVAYAEFDQPLALNKPAAAILVQTLSPEDTQVCLADSGMKSVRR